MNTIGLPWTDEEFNYLVEAVEQSTNFKSAFKLVNALIPKRTVAAIAYKFYNAAKEGKLDGVITSAKFLKMREKQRLILIEEGKERVRLANQFNEDIANLRAQVVQRHDEDDTAYAERIHAISLGREDNNEELVDDENLSETEQLPFKSLTSEGQSFTVAGTTSLGGISLKGNFKITGTFIVEILALD